MASVTAIVYIQDKFGWVVGFGVPVVLMFLSTVLFLLGYSLYVQVKANKSLFTGFAQVVAVAFRNKHLALPPINSDVWYYHKGSKLFVAPTGKLRYYYDHNIIILHKLLLLLFACYIYLTLLSLY